MGKHKEITIYQREKELVDLIEDARELNFNPSLLQKYEKQLSGIQAELQKEKDKKNRFNQENMIKRFFEQSKIKDLGNGCYSVPSSFFALGITPTIINEVLKGGCGILKNGN